jgi:hypothetical protein
MRFLRKSPVPRPMQARVHHPWDQPAAEIPAIVPINTLVLQRSEETAIAITGISAYSAGFEITVTQCFRPGRSASEHLPDMRGERFAALQGVACQVRGQSVHPGPQDSVRGVGGQEPAPAHLAGPGQERRIGAQDGHEPAEEHDLRAEVEACLCGLLDQGVVAALSVQCSRRTSSLCASSGESKMLQASA